VSPFSVVNPKLKGTNYDSLNTASCASIEIPLFKSNFVNLTIWDPKDFYWKFFET